MKPNRTTSASRHNLAPALLALVLVALFWRCFQPNFVQFSNDGPVGQLSSAWLQFPAGLTGMWDDLNYIGANAGCYPLDATAVLRWCLGPIGFSKFLVPVALFILGFGAWTFFRALKLSPLASGLGAFIVALNSAFFSTACWGVASQQVAYGFDFMALALVVSIVPEMPGWERWSRLVLAGMAVGLNVMEGADIGAIMSLFVAVFVCYHAWATAEGGALRGLTRGAVRVSVIAVSAVFIAGLSVTTLINTQIKGVAGTQQDEKTKQAHWNFATQWSLPKRETLALVIPGLFGYRMNTPDGSTYWGIGGRDAAWEAYLKNGKKGPAPEGFIRQAGGGNYMGVTVVLLVFWAAFQAFRKDSVFKSKERRLLVFWTAAAAVSLLLAYGKFAPFFQFVYALPYASAIRNPGKFMSIFVFSATTLGACGVDGLCRGYLGVASPGAAKSPVKTESWWARATAFDKRWTVGCLVVIGLSLIGWGAYAASRSRLEQYLNEVELGGEFARSIAAFSLRQVGWYMLFLTLGVTMITLILSGRFGGGKAKLGGILLGLLVVVDLGRSDLNWIRPVDYVEKNATNPVLEFLRQKPYEHRVALLPWKFPPQFGLFRDIYTIEWAQHQMPCYDIQSLDVIQEPRMPSDKAAFEGALIGDGGTNSSYYPRRWVLTNTRYLLGPAPYLQALNQELDPVQQRFGIAASFDLGPRPGIEHPLRYEEITAYPNTNGTGQYAVFDFAGALPRAKLYTHWRVSTNDPAVLQRWTAAVLKRLPAEWGNPYAGLSLTDLATLKEVTDSSFDPAQTVLLSAPIPQTAVSTATNPNPDSVEYVSYTPKDIKLKTQAAAPTVLLLNDKYDPSWKVSVDGQRAELLRCNFIMRGVALPAGSHEVEFQFKPNLPALYSSLVALAVGVLLTAVVFLPKPTKRPGGNARRR